MCQSTGGGGRLVRERCVSVYRWGREVGEGERCVSLQVGEGGW